MTAIPNNTKCYTCGNLYTIATIDQHVHNVHGTMIQAAMQTGVVAAHNGNKDKTTEDNSDIQFVKVGGGKAIHVGVKGYSRALCGAGSRNGMGGRVGYIVSGPATCGRCINAQYVK